MIGFFWIFLEGEVVVKFVRLIGFGVEILVLDDCCVVVCVVRLIVLFDSVVFLDVRFIEFGVRIKWLSGVCVVFLVVIWLIDNFWCVVCDLSGFIGCLCIGLFKVCIIGMLDILCDKSECFYIIVFIINVKEIVVLV